MKACTISKYGSPNNVQVKEVDTPIPKYNEVRVRIITASVNAADLEIVKGYLFVRLLGGFRKPKVKILGCDFAGLVESIGELVTQFKPGDEVYADLMYQKHPYGALAEFVCVPENSLRMKPQSMTFEEASTIGQAGVLAIQGIKGKIPPEEGYKVLINGAGGGVGSFAIQIAKYYGAEVTAVDSEEKFDMMKNLGADHVIDYIKEDFTKNNDKYDLILDVIAKKSVFSYRKVLKKNGIYRCVGGTTGRIFQIVFLGKLLSRFSGKKVGILVGKPNEKEDMEFLTELYETKKVVPIIEKSYILEQVPEALRHLEEGKVKGKLVIQIK